jgi:nitric oxide reductase large subunit
VEPRAVVTMAHSRVPLFLSVDIIMTMLTLAFVVLRVTYRWQKRRLNISDYLICIAMVWPTTNIAVELGD